MALSDAELAKLRAHVNYVPPAPSPPPAPAKPPRTPRQIAIESLFSDANSRRSRRAAAVRVQHAEAALTDLTAPYTEIEVKALRLRVAHPGDTLAQLGEKIGVSKYVIASALRRAIIKAEKAGVLP